MLVDQLSTFTPWSAHPARRVYVPKANGRLRRLGIPDSHSRILAYSCVMVELETPPPDITLALRSDFPPDYAKFLTDLKQRIRIARVRAALSVNRAVAPGDRDQAVRGTKSSRLAVLCSAYDER